MRPGKGCFFIHSCNIWRCWRRMLRYLLSMARLHISLRSVCILYSISRFIPLSYNTYLYFGVRTNQPRVPPVWKNRFHLPHKADGPLCVTFLDDGTETYALTVCRYLCSCPFTDTWQQVYTVVDELWQYFAGILAFR